MPPMAGLAGDADLLLMGSAECKNFAKRLQRQMRLIPQKNCPMGQFRLPSLPTGGALDRTEHASFGSSVENPVRGGKAKPIQFFSNRFIISCAYAGDLF